VVLNESVFLEDISLYDGNSIITLQIVIKKKLMVIMTYKQHLIFNVISK